MPKYLTIFVAFTMAAGINYGKEFPQPKAVGPAAKPFLLAQTDEPPGRRLQSAAEKKEFGKVPRGHRLPKGEREHLERFRMAKLLELLELTEEQRQEFLPLFKKIRKGHHRTIRKRVRAVEKLGQLLKRKKTSDRKIQELIDEISGLEKQKISQQEDFLAGCREILTPVQFGKLIVFQDRFELRMLGKLRGFRGRGEVKLRRQEMPGVLIEDKQDSNLIRNDSDQ